MERRDLLFRDQRIIVFVNDCFWYRHADCLNLPPEPPAFWTARAERIRNRNLKTFKRLTLKGWTVITVWNCHDEKDSAKGSGDRRYLLEYLQTIYRELSRILLLFTS